MKLTFSLTSYFVKFLFKINGLNQLPLIGAEFNELTLTEVHSCVSEVVVNEANVLH